METDEYDEMSLCLGASLNVVGVYAVPYEKGFSWTNQYNDIDQWHS